MSEPCMCGATDCKRCFPFDEPERDDYNEYRDDYDYDDEIDLLPGYDPRRDGPWHYEPRGEDT